MNRWKRKKRLDPKKKHAEKASQELLIHFGNNFSSEDILKHLPLFRVNRRLTAQLQRKRPEVQAFVIDALGVLAQNGIRIAYSRQGQVTNVSVPENLSNEWKKEFITRIKIISDMYKLKTRDIEKILLREEQIRAKLRNSFPQNHKIDELTSQLIMHAKEGVHIDIFKQAADILKERWRL